MTDLTTTAPPPPAVWEALTLATYRVPPQRDAYATHRDVATLTDRVPGRVLWAMPRRGLLIVQAAAGIWMGRRYLTQRPASPESGTSSDRRRQQIVEAWDDRCAAINAKWDADIRAAYDANRRAGPE